MSTIDQQLVCLTGAVPKTYITCPRCEGSESLMTIETFGPSREEPFSFGSHSHSHRPPRHRSCQIRINSQPSISRLLKRKQRR